MKKIMLLFVALITTAVYSQDKRSNEYRELIDSAISVIAEHRYKQLSENISKESIIIYVMDEEGKQINLDNVKSKFTLRTIDIYDKKNRKLLKDGLKISQVSPVLNGNLITVMIINFMVNYKGKRYYFVNGGGSTVFFQYSCEEEKWILTKVEHNSI